MFHHHRLAQAAAALGLALTSLTSGPAAAQSYEISPLLAELQPTASRSEQTFRVLNKSDTPIAVEAIIRQRLVSDSGQNLDGEISEDFILVPPQMVVPAQGSQTLRLRWIGEPQLERELPFRMRVRQIPVTFDAPGEGGRVTVAFSYVANIYVAPPGAASDIALTKAEPLESEGKRHLAITLENRGTKRAVIDKAELQVTGADGATSLAAGSPATEALTTQTILAGASRVFLLPWPDALTFGPITASLNAQYLIR
ncbi:fimbrial chaperone protein [Brevundimonas bullata]|uniref:Fimbrial chaperone protein n=1 Tax=Brevundimonas bullata TaxID=13160 RepID=A0A7W7N3A6_9CAUL|nr:fimbria/pilus periplasmic chaperone [Brevundimonas bullata]MBB4798245.1 fimbrial chaperone protein [Brevundimonas bullata]MBB6383441.1 fimbrial chaperone protein [Brevundimonas bullata]